MEIKTEKIMVENFVTSYVADDGKEFPSERECKEHEERQAKYKYIEAAEKLRIKEMDDQIPLSDDGMMSDTNSYRWYRLNNKEDYDMVNMAYGDSFVEPKSYPEIMCVETVGYKIYLDDAYYYYMATCKTITENFWKKLGYQVTFKKIGGGYHE